MTDHNEIPAAPATLGDAGTTFWNAVVARWSLRPDEEQLLLAAAKTLDEIARLEAVLAEQSMTVTGSRGQHRVNGLVREIREHRLSFQRLIGTSGIGIAEADAAGAGTAKSNAGRALALARHHG